MSVYVMFPAGVAVYFVVLAWIFRSRPETDFDRYCAALDEEFDRDERRVRAELYGRSF